MNRYVRLTLALLTVNQVRLIRNGGSDIRTYGKDAYGNLWQLMAKVILGLDDPRKLTARFFS